ncbi:histidine phosphatase family protein [Sphingomonas sp. ac-8]|uniref:histidine phosphatase family protein n=1 Tax=Sphingomonas sp. ac-8 TaxID=3242977 RepID=UPI003A80AE99
MATRLTLLCAGATASARRGGFPRSDERLDAGGRAKIAALELEIAGQAWTSPARAAVETAALLGLAAEQEAALRDLDHGAWAGRSLEDLHAQDPDALIAWLAAPERGAPGGERLESVAARMSAWMAQVAAADRPVLAITHAAVIRAAIASALGVPVAATLRIDVAPLSRTVLSFHGQWRLQELRR